MSGAPTRQQEFTAAMAEIAALPPAERIDALLRFFADVLSAMDSATIRRMRDQLMTRFATCGCSFETCELVIEFINGQLALRDAQRRVAQLN